MGHMINGAAFERQFKITAKRTAYWYFIFNILTYNLSEAIVRYAFNNLIILV